MNRTPSQPFIRIIVTLLSTRGWGRWLGVALVAALLAVFWWQPQRVVPRTGSADDRAVAGRETSDVIASRQGQPTTRPPGEVRDGSANRPPGLPGQLRDEGRGVYRSPAGLVYTRGSEHGHRLQHVLAHGHDVPDRPGQHGVFADNRPESILGLIDQAYAQAERNEATQRKRDQERTILTIDLGRVIGYIGGQVGNRRGRPMSRHLRLVLEDDRVITAYPVIP